MHVEEVSDEEWEDQRAGRKIREDKWIRKWSLGLIEKGKRDKMSACVCEVELQSRESVKDRTHYQLI